MKYFLDKLSPKDTKYKNEDIFTSIQDSNDNSNNTIQLASEVQKKINYKSFDEIIDFYNSNEDSFVKAYEKTGINIWFLEHFRLYFNYRNFFLNLETVNTFLAEHKDGKIITSDKKLSLFIEESKLKFAQAQTSKENNLKSLVKEFLCILKNARILKINKPKNILFSNINNNIDGIDKRFGSLKDSNEKIILRTLFIKSNQKCKKIKSQHGTNSDSILLKYILSLKWIVELIRFNKTLKQLKQDIYKPEQALSNEHLIINNFFWSKKTSFFIYYVMYKSFENYFKKAQTESIFLSDENSPQNKLIQYAAAKHNIKIYSVQHGTIHDLHPAYIYGKYNTKPLLPNITFTWGDHFSKLLTSKGGYSSNNVISVGKIPIINEPRYKNPLLLRNKKDILLYASQPQRDSNLRKQQLKDVLQTSKMLSTKYQLVIRPHPNETDDSFFQKEGHDLNFNDFIIDRQTDLKTHFESCAILITSFSTVGTEFIPYYKPMLILDYLKQDLIGYISEGVGIQITTQTKLYTTLNNSEIVINKEKYTNFIIKHLYADDDEAVTRINKHINAK